MESRTASSAGAKRPAGVALLTVLLLAGGLGLLLAAFLTDGRREQLDTAIGPAGFAAITVYGGIVTVALVALAAGVGFARRRSWGWWLGTFTFAFGAAYNVDAAIDLQGAQEAADGDAAVVLLAYGVGALAHGAVYLYLFRERVRSWFAAGAVPALGVVAADAGVCAAIFAAEWFVNG